MEDFKIIFMGTPDFASASLKALYQGNYNISAVFTQPDRPKSRGMKLTMSPVKELALANGTPVYQPETLKDDDVYRIISDINPDLIVAVAYGKLLPERILNLPKLGCINIHGSLLPKYRGAAPIQRSVINGDQYAGVTAMFLDKTMDTGDIIDFEKTEIKEYETSGELFDRLAPMGGSLLVRTVANLKNGTYTRTKQNEAEATYAAPLSKDESPIPFEKTVFEVIRHIYGMSPWPTATMEINGTKFKVFSATYSEKKGNAGEIISTGNEGICVGCSDGAVLITEIQAPGGKRMKAGDYLRGHKL